MINIIEINRNIIYQSYLNTYDAKKLTINIDNSNNIVVCEKCLSDLYTYLPFHKGKVNNI